MTALPNNPAFDSLQRFPKRFPSMPPTIPELLQIARKCPINSPALVRSAGLFLGNKQPFPFSVITPLLGAAND